MTSNIKFEVHTKLGDQVDKVILIHAAAARTNCLQLTASSQNHRPAENTRQTCVPWLAPSQIDESRPDPGWAQSKCRCPIAAKASLGTFGQLPFVVVPPEIAVCGVIRLRRRNGLCEPFSGNDLFVLLLTFVQHQQINAVHRSSGQLATGEGDDVTFTMFRSWR